MGAGALSPLVVDVLLHVRLHSVRGPLHCFLNDPLHPVCKVLHNLFPFRLSVLQHDCLTSAVTNVDHRGLNVRVQLKIQGFWINFSE